MNGYIIIPVRNEEESIPIVIQDIQKLNLVPDTSILIIDNGSTDSTSNVLKKFNITYLYENNLGYGSACLKAIEYLKTLPNPPEWVAFMDGDRSDYAEDLPILVDVIQKGNANLVTGDRTFFWDQNKSLQFIQKFGNRLVCFLIKLFYKIQLNDLGPLRVIPYDKLLLLNMEDTTWGWNIEMNIKAIQYGLKIQEIPVRYRNRYSGKSKISGNWKMVLPVGLKILETFFRLLKNHKKGTIKAFLSILILFQCSNKTLGIDTYMNKIWDLRTTWIVSPAQGVSLYTDQTILIDVRSYTNRFISPLKNSIYLDWKEFSLDSKPDRGKLKNKEEILKILSSKNINKDSILLIIGDPLGGWGEEGRIIWMFRELEFINSYIIDGGKKYWDLANEQPISKNISLLKADKTKFTSYDIQALELKEKLNSPNFIVLDTREKREYLGSTPYGETRGGHIPNSKWFYFKDLFDSMGFIKEKQKVESMLSSINANPSSSIVTYCTGGVRSAMVTAILVSYGIQSKNYSGSMWEWSSLKEEDGYLLSK